MENQGLLFIPDISGFTRFVNETDINHSRLIIEELLEILINANQIGLEVSEIEGDAILFYRFGDAPPLEEVYKQVEKMFLEFHRHLSAYEYRRYCYCPACSAAINLSLKVITHYGEFTSYSVKNFHKLIGKDIIIVHQLLKNDIEHHEYWLVTKKLLHDDKPAHFAEWMKWMNSIKQTENGDIPFHYTQLSELKHTIPPPQSMQLNLSKKVKVISASGEYDVGILTLLHASADFNNRSRWQVGVKKVEMDNHFLPRVGMKCRYLLENGDTRIWSSSYAFHPERIEFSETDEREKSLRHYILERIDDNRSKISIDVYIEKTILQPLLFKLAKKKQMEEETNKSLENLGLLVKEIKLLEQAG
jgi:hypothetical protein